MQKVITINLNGNAYQLDEIAYEALRTYVAHAQAQLGGNPDRIEIIKDLEQSIAEKCLRFLGPGKTVVSALEMEQILRDVGPVEGDPSEAGAPHAQHTPRDTGGGTIPPKRLYQIREGAILSGVCNGLAAYFNLDPTIVRVAFVATFLLLAITRGDAAFMVVLLYLLLMFLVPYAKTPEQLAAAQGSSDSIPYRAQQFVEKVKRKFRGREGRATR